MDNKPEAPVEQPQPTVISPSSPHTETPSTVAPTTPEPYTPAQLGPAQPVVTPPAKGSKKKLLLVAGIAASILAIAGATYYAFILPNNPAHTYSKGLERSGVALSTLVERATAANQLDAYGSSQLEGDYTVNSNGQTFSGKLGSSYDKQASDSSVSFKGEQGQNISLKFLTNLAKGSAYPDIYFQFSGLSTLMPGLETYDSKWISVSSSYIESMLKQAGNTGNKDSFQFSAEDAASLAKIAADKTSEYVLTNDKTKAVFDEEKFIATETIDGVKANRYQVAINKAHLSAYCTALADSLISSPAYKHIVGSDETVADDKKRTLKDCQKTPDNLDKKSYDLWINTKSKLIYKIRVSDKSDKNTYVEFGQNYSGGNSLPMFANFHSDKEKYDAKLAVTSDIENSTSVAKLTAKMTGNQDATVTAKLSLKPYKGTVKINVPTNAIPLQKILGDFGFGNTPTYSGSSGTGSVSQQRSNILDNLPF